LQASSAGALPSGLGPLPPASEGDGLAAGGALGAGEAVAVDAPPEAWPLTGGAVATEPVQAARSTAPIRSAPPIRKRIRPVMVE